MIRIVLLLNLALAMIFVGCYDEVVSKQCVGEVVKISPIPTSWNDNVKTGVETTKGTFIVLGSVSAMKGAKAWITTYTSRQTYLCIEGKSKCPKVIGF